MLTTYSTPQKSFDSVKELKFSKKAVSKQGEGLIGIWSKHNHYLYKNTGISEFIYYRLQDQNKGRRGRKTDSLYKTSFTLKQNMGQF